VETKFNSLHIFLIRREKASRQELKQKQEQERVTRVGEQEELEKLRQAENERLKEEGLEATKKEDQGVATKQPVEPEGEEPILSSRTGKGSFHLLC